MSGRKLVLLPFQLFDNQSLNGSFSSDAVNIQYLDNVALQMAWSAGAEGTFDVEVSINYNPHHPDLAIWTPIVLDPEPTADGDADSAALNILALSFPFVRLTYNSSFAGGSLLAVADVAGSLNSKYFSLSNVDEVDYYVWMNVNGAGVNPNIPNKTGIRIDLATNASAATVAAAIKTAFEGIIGLSNISINTATVTFNIEDETGTVAANDSGFTISFTPSASTLDAFISAKMS